MRTSTIMSVLALAYKTSANIVNLGSAITYGVLSGGAGITNEGPSVITGNVGTTAKSISGFPPGIVTGTQHIGDSFGSVAFTDASLAYNQAKALSANYDYSVLNDFTGKTLYPGVYFVSGTISLNGQLFLDARGNPTATWVFQMGSSLLINIGSQVVLQNGAKACNIFWQTGSSATISVGTDFKGNVLAYAGISVKTAASVSGGLYALTQSITLQDNAIGAQVC